MSRGAQIVVIVSVGTRALPHPTLVLKRKRKRRKMNFIVEVLISFFWNDFEANEHPYVLAFMKGFLLFPIMFIYVLVTNITSPNSLELISIFKAFISCLIGGVGIGILLIFIEFIFSSNK